VSETDWTGEPFLGTSVEKCLQDILPPIPLSHEFHSCESKPLQRNQIQHTSFF